MSCDGIVLWVFNHKDSFGPPRLLDIYFQIKLLSHKI